MRKKARIVKDGGHYAVMVDDLLYARFLTMEEAYDYIINRMGCLL